MSKMSDHWEQYLVGLGKTTKPISTNSVLPFDTTSSKIGVSGFLDLRPTPSNAQFQTKYDAMSATWEGVHASEKATLKSRSDKTEFATFQ
jgi:hypothetical protein